MPQHTLSGFLLLINAVCIASVFTLVFFAVRPRREQGRSVSGVTTIAIVLGSVAFTAAVINGFITFSS